MMEAVRSPMPRFTMRPSSLLVPLLLLAVAPASPAQSPTRGELLYTTHCVACHTKEVHWRARRLATDWPTLTDETRRWQRNLGLKWTDDEVGDVVRYLNTTIYRFPDQAPKQTG